MKRFTDIKKASKIKRINEGLLDNETDQLKPNLLPKRGEIPETGEITKSEPAKFFSKIFESRQMAHIYHLQVKGEGSFAAHKALDDYYSNIIDLIDEFIETYQGQWEIVENYEIIDTSKPHNLEKVQYFIELAEFIRETRYSAILKEDTHLHNIIDEIVGLIYRTLYKLKNLK